MIFGSLKAQRRSRRHWIAIPARIYALGGRIDGMTINVSEHGMYVFAAASLAVGAEVQVEFRWPHKERFLTTSGIVRRKAVYLYAIEFLQYREGGYAFLQTGIRVAPVDSIS